MKISIQQPEYFPWLGFVDKIWQVDKVVFLDSVQFKKRYFENRNKVRTRQGWTWLNTPVITKGRYTQKISEVEIDNFQPWQKKIISTIMCSYKKTPYWNELGDELCGIISKPYKFLVDFNMAVILLLMKKFGIMRPWCIGSSLNIKYAGSDLILEICQKMNANEYLSGKSGGNYIKEESFIRNGIRIVYQDFDHPVYSQLHGGFESGMSAIDIYFNHGPKSIDIIKKLSSVKYSNESLIKL